MIEEAVEAPGNDRPVLGFIQDDAPALAYHRFVHGTADLVVFQLHQVRESRMSRRGDAIAELQIIQRAAAPEKLDHFAHCFPLLRRGPCSRPSHSSLIY